MYMYNVNKLKDDVTTTIIINIMDISQSNIVAYNSVLKEQLENVNKLLEENDELIRIQKENCKLEKQLKKANDLLKHITIIPNSNIYDTFVTQKIRETNSGKIKETSLYEVFKIWFQLHHGKNVPKGRDLFDYMNKRFGKKQRGIWNNVSIIYDDFDTSIYESEDEYGSTMSSKNDSNIVVNTDV